MDKDSHIYWHEAFQEVLQLELHEYRDVLIFENDYKLSEEALRMDAVIIKKDRNARIDKNIGRIFQGHNIFEYKSETVTFTRRDYDKVRGYALLYSSFTDTPPEDITISISLTIFPQKLVGLLTQERGLTLEETESGIYYIYGDIFPIQLLESKKLPQEDNLFLRNLRSNLNAVDMAKTLTVYKQQRQLDSKSVYLDRLIQANYNSYKEAGKMSEETITLILADAEEKGWLKNRDNEKAKGIAKRMLLLGDSAERVAAVTELPLETVLALA